MIYSPLLVLIPSRFLPMVVLRLGGGGRAGKVRDSSLIPYAVSFLVDNDTSGMHALHARRNVKETPGGETFPRAQLLAHLYVTYCCIT